VDREINADVIVVGGGTGGCAAALAAARMGTKVLLTEETGWIGGQLTSQAVPPDEHPWIERFGCTRSYRRFREGIRRYLRGHFPLAGETLAVPVFRPGNALVSSVAYPPRVGLAVLEQMLAPHTTSGRVTVLLRNRPVAAEVEGDLVRSVTVEDLDLGDRAVLTGSHFLDATELGDLLPLAGVEYATGSESSEETGEPHAPKEADPLDMQAITHCFAVDHLPGEDHTIDRPQGYAFWREHRADFWPDRQLSWCAPDPPTLEPRPLSLFSEEDGFPLWRYRRIVDRDQFLPGTFESDITLVNWPQNDYWLGPICEVDGKEAARNLRGAKELSLSLLYWMQTEAPRPDGGHGYPGLRLRADLVGTEDGLAKCPYVRESRRVRAEQTVVEQDLSPEIRPQGAREYPDSVGVGSYRMDLHPSTGGRNYIDLPCHPFQIPLGCLIPIRMENLLPACKNIGTTHITNGCYRLHPVEWNVGEAAGVLAAYCASLRLRPRQVRNTPSRLSGFQRMLVDQGFELRWPEVHPL
jgi:FAD dependent oxidoreductase